MAVLVGKKAPLFEAEAVVNGGEFVEKFTLEQYIGKKYVVFFFYPLDFTFVCPTEILAFQEKMEEFEKRKSPEARFANTVDRFIAFILNYASGGKIWKEHGIRKHQVLMRMAPVEDGSEKLWDYVNQLIHDAVAGGILAE